MNAEVDPMVVAVEVAAILEENQIPYVIGGSVASTLFGEPRATMDVDFAVQLLSERVEVLAAAFEDAFFVQRETMFEAARSHRMFNLVHRNSMMKVDMHVRPSEGIFAEEIRRALRLKLQSDPDGFAAVATPEDTLLQKLRWYQMSDEVSDRQWRDVLGILKAMGPDLDSEYLRRWSLEMGLQDLLVRALKQVDE